MENGGDSKNGLFGFPPQFKFMEETITPEQIDALDKLFDAWEGVSIQTDEDLTALVGPELFKTEF